jgi:hypothetical protein
MRMSAPRHAPEPHNAVRLRRWLCIKRKVPRQKGARPDPWRCARTPDPRSLRPPIDERAASLTFPLSGTVGR